MPAVGSLYTPSAADAQEWAFTGDAVGDPVVFTTYVPQIADAGHVPYKVQNEILARIKSAISGSQYQKIFTCLAGDAVGSAVYISANDTVATAKADTTAHAQPIGFIIYKPTTTTCVVVHYYQAVVAGAVAGSIIYLKDDGTFGPAAGTIAVPIGIAYDVTHALLLAGPLSPFQSFTQQQNGLFVFPAEIDLKTAATTTLSVVGGSSNPQALSIKISTLGGTFTGQPSFQFGKTGTNNKFIDTLATIGLANVGERRKYDTLANDDATTSYTFTITTPATGSSTIKAFVIAWGSPPQ